MFEFMCAKYIHNKYTCIQLHTCTNTHTHMHIAHARQVIWKHLYKCSSSMDIGTLYHLRNVLNRRDVIKHPKDKMSACESFFLIVAEAHIISAAMKVFEMSSPNDKPSSKYFPQGSSELRNLERRHLLLLATSEVVKQYVDLSFGTKSATTDHVKAYASEVLKFGLLLMEFNDAVTEGDGNRILRCWKYFFLFFKVSGRNNLL